MLAAVEAALRAHFAFDARALGQPVQQSDVIAVAQAVPGVVAVDLDASLWRHRSRLRRPASRSRCGCSPRACASSGGVAQPAELLTLDPGAARPPGGDGMSTLTAERLYALLPAVYRVRDAEQGEPLRALLGAVAQEFAALEENVEQLYDDQFIETCADWVAPYIGDLIGYRPLHGVAPTIASPRAEVANTIALSPPQGHGADARAAGAATSPTGRRTRSSSSSSSPPRST